MIVSLMSSPLDLNTTNCSRSKSVFSLGQDAVSSRSAVQVRDCMRGGCRYWIRCNQTLRCRVVVLDSFKAATFIKREKEKWPDLPFVRMLKSSVLQKIVVGSCWPMFIGILRHDLGRIIPHRMHPTQLGLSLDKSAKIRELNSPNILEGLSAALLSRVHLENSFEFWNDDVKHLNFSFLPLVRSLRDPRRRGRECHWLAARTRKRPMSAERYGLRQSDLSGCRDAPGVMRQSRRVVGVGICEEASIAKSILVMSIDTALYNFIQFSLTRRASQSVASD